MSYPKILSIGYSVPPKSYTQEEVWNALGYQTSHFKRIFMGGEIQKRYLWIDPHKIRDLDWQGLQDEYLVGATDLSAKSVRACLDGHKADNIGCVVYVSCTGYLCPSVGHRIAPQFNFPSNISFTSILGMGCEGGYPGLMRAKDYVVANGKPALVIATELSTCTFFKEDGGVPDSDHDYEVLRANAIFADASVCALVGYDNDPRHPYIVDTENYFVPDYLEDLGFVWSKGRLRVRLTRRVPELAAVVTGVATRRLLDRNNLGLSDIPWMIIHAAGSRVLDNIRDYLGVPERKMALSRSVLRDFGNCSSTTIGLIGKRLMDQNVQPGDWVLVVSVGPGMVGGATLLRFPGGGE